MPAFWTGWALWIQMTFVLFVALVVTFAIGVSKNLFIWHQNRQYLRLNGALPTSAGDIEAQINPVAAAAADDPPFGIRALEQGIQVEGVYISRTNTPAASTHVPSRRGSPAPSISSNAASSHAASSHATSSNLLYSSNNLFSSWSGQSSIAMPQPVNPGRQSNVSHWSGMCSPSFDLGSSNSLNSTEFPGDYPRSSFNSRHVDINSFTGPTRNSATLDALEGRPRGSEQGQTRHQKSVSKSSTLHSNGSRQSARDSSPSPPALTDGVSRPDSPMSGDARSLLPTSLSESNHRLSHVAETGQLAPRFRHAKTTDGVHFPVMSNGIRGAPFFFENRPLPTSPLIPVLRVPPSSPILSAPSPAVVRSGPVRHYSDPLFQSTAVTIPADSILNNHFELRPLSALDFGFDSPAEKSFSSKRNSVSYRKSNASFEVRQVGARGPLPLPLAVTEAGIIKRKRSTRKLRKRRKGENPQSKRVSLTSLTSLKENNFN